MDNKYIELLKNLGLITIGKVLAKIVSVLVLPFYTAYLDPTDYGRVDIVTAYVALFLQPVTLCIDSAIFIFPNGKPLLKQRKYFSTGLFLSLIPLSMFTVILLGCRHFFPGQTEESFMGTMTRNALIISLLMFSGFLCDFLQQMLKTLNKIKLYAIIGVIQSLALISISFYMLPRWGVSGYMYSLFISTVLVVLLMFYIGGLGKWFSLKAIKIRYYVHMLHYSLPLVIAPALVWVQLSSNKPILASNCGLAAVGILGFACRFPGLLNYFSTSLCNSWEISALKERSKPGFRDFNNTISLTFFILGSLACIILSIVTEPIFRLLINEKFYEAIQYIPMAYFAMFVTVSGQLVGVNLTVSRESKKFLYSSIVSVIVATAGNFLLIPLWGVWGAVISMALTSLSVLIARYILSNELFRLRAINKIMLCLGALLLWTIMYAELSTITYRVIITFLYMLVFVFCLRDYFYKGYKMICAK